MLKFRQVLLVTAMIATLILIFPLVMLARLCSRHFAYRIGASWGMACVFFIRVIGGIRMHVTGELPTAPSIICVKHQSMLDVFLMLAVFGKQSWVMKQSLLDIPFFGWGLRTIQPIAIDRKKGKRAMQQMQIQGADKLRNGYHVILYPEGTRVPPLQSVRYKSGAVRLAQALTCPIIPVAHNAGLFWHKKHWLIQTGVVEITILPPIDFADWSVDEGVRTLQNTIDGRSDTLTRNSAAFSSYQRSYLPK